MKVKGRNELKHIITKADGYLLRRQLGEVLKIDTNANGDGTYHIRSLYFDNCDNKIVRQKIDGLYNRIKFRIRLYNYDTSIVHLEKKEKINNVSFKEKCPITEEEFNRIKVQDIEWMKDDTRRLFRELYLNMKLYRLRPNNIVDYTREAYIYHGGNVRITLDYHVKSSVNNIEVFDKNIKTVNAVDQNTMILEVKFDEYLPDIIKRIVQIGNRRRESVSKYLLSRQYL